MEAMIFTNKIPPEQRRQLARSLLAAVKDTPTEEKPTKQLVMIDDITCKPELVYNAAAIIKLYEAIIAVDDTTLLTMDGLDLSEVMDKFVFNH